ncbi:MULTISPECIES: hypothetical protein [Streptomyces]|uniref:hypothetical protein n=1 Tax=Streptomyces TaxID=1883 RepID=UPI000A49CB59|nr:MULTISPECIES: hypothetical protein [Streptomyces]MDP9954283.1 hypothetical protein [Streptomyces sp. DSM 41269]
MTAQPRTYGTGTEFTILRRPSHVGGRGRAVPRPVSRPRTTGLTHTEKEATS